MARADVNTILAEAEAELTTALTSDPHERLMAMTRFMHAFEQIGREVAAGAATWDDTRPWAARNAERLQSARSALNAWEFEMGQLFYHGGEEDALRAFNRRTQHAFAREVFRDTPADEMLANYEDDEVDAEFHDEAERLALDGPSWAPRTHTWWRWSTPA